ncbi:MAG: hypothetical protein IKZ58_05985 [Selenomonadaceae bacterium]|nr:hypothetical protein [Selenomonadaceae bacterium]
MDVTLNQSAIRFANPTQGVAAYASSSSQNANSTVDVGNAYEVNISDAAKQAQQSSKVAAVNKTETQPAEVQTKGVATSVVEELREDIKLNEQAMINVMIQAMTDSNSTLQNWLNNGQGILHYGDKQIEAAKFGIPEVATNPADAAKAVGEGGAWSVDSVAGRLFDLASSIAGNDPEKLQEMRDAVEEGFKQAGVAWENMTGSSSMPDITRQTYNELMHRFDMRMKELTSGAA